MTGPGSSGTTTTGLGKIIGGAASHTVSTESVVKQFQEAGYEITTLGNIHHLDLEAVDSVARLTRVRLARRHSDNDEISVLAGRPVMKGALRRRSEPVTAAADAVRSARSNAKPQDSRQSQAKHLVTATARRAASVKASAKAGCQEVGPDADDQHADKAADQQISIRDWRRAPVYPPTSPPMPSAMPSSKSGATAPGVWSDKMTKVITPASEVTCVDARVAGRPHGLWPDPTRTGARNAPPPSP